MRANVRGSRRPLRELTTLRRRVAELEDQLAAAQRRKVPTGHVARTQVGRLLEIVRDLASSLHVEDLMRRLCAEAREALDVYGSAVYLLVEGGTTLRPVVAIEPPYEDKVLATDLDVSKSFTGEAVRAGRGVVFNDAYESPRGQHVPGTPEVTDERVMAVPLVVDGDVVGAMCLNRTGKPFARADLELGELLASYASVALKNARTHEALQQATEARRGTQRALAWSERRYETLFDHFPVALYRTTPDGRILDANVALVGLLGYPSKETLLGTPVSELYADPSEREAELDALSREGLVHAYALRLKRYDGGVVWVEDTTRLVRDQTGAPLYYEGSLVDVTERKRIEAEREQLIVELQGALAEVKTLAGLLPVCAWCRKIRDDSGYWQELEDYLLSHFDTRFTHGICPDCLEKMKGELGESGSPGKAVGDAEATAENE